MVVKNSAIDLLNIQYCYGAGAKGGTKMVQVTPLRRTLASSP